MNPGLHLEGAFRCSGLDTKGFALMRQAKGVTTQLPGANYIYELVPRNARKTSPVRLTYHRLRALSGGVLF